MIKLRDYQENLIQKLRERFAAGKKRLLLQLPTGAGKTILAADMLKGASTKGNNALFIVHRMELLEQTAEALKIFDIPHGIIASGYRYVPGHRVYIASIQTLVRRLHIIDNIKIVFFDECHHIAAGSWKKVFSSFPKSWVIGLTATSIRLDGKGLSEFFDEIIQGPSVQSLIDQGYLSRYRYFAPEYLNTAALRVRMGEFLQEDLEEALNSVTITGKAIDEYKKHGEDGQFIVFAVSIAHSIHIVEEFDKHGISARHVDGTMKKKERLAIMEMFRNRDISVLSNVNLFGEGVDIPDLKGILMLRPTKSLSLYLQMCGRALRPSPGKDCAIILDHSNNIYEHGSPCEDRLWTLRGCKSGETKLKECPRCFAHVPIGAEVCTTPGCGYEFTPIQIEAPKKEREIEPLEGKLEEIDVGEINRLRKREQALARDFDSLLALGKKRGYKHPAGWARHPLKARALREQ